MKKYNDAIVVSAVNLVNGGTFTILKSCLNELSKNESYRDYRIIALVHATSLFAKNEQELKQIYPNIEFVEFPAAKKNYIFRCWYEYVYFYFLSKKIKPKIWLSLHDMSPRVDAKYQYVYMHNPSPFYKKKALDKKFALFCKFYKVIYRMNVRSNHGVIVQQDWLRQEFSKLLSYPKEKIIVAYPEFDAVSDISDKFIPHSFFYPSYPREFKNFEVICRAADILAKDESLPTDWKVILTINGTENNYSKGFVPAYRNNSHIEFAGLLDSKNMKQCYDEAECLIFPSLLETWGLPISEFKVSGKKMILANLPYAKETANNAKQAAFFEPENEVELSKLMKNVMLEQNGIFESVKNGSPQEPFCSTWKELMEKMIEHGN